MELGTWECVGYGEIEECGRVVREDGLFCDPSDTAQGSVIVLCKKCAAAARADGTTLVPASEYEVAN
jgi:hypothetical protein